MLAFPWFTKTFGPGKYETFEVDGRKKYTFSENTKAIEIVLIPTISFSTMNNLNYTINVSFLCWDFSFTYWKIKFLK